MTDTKGQHNASVLFLTPKNHVNSGTSQPQNTKFQVI